MSPESAVDLYARSGDPNAFRTLVESYQNLVYSVCRRILPHSDVDDAVQEVFVKLTLHAPRISSDLGAWLHACAVNTCRDMLRRNQSRRKRETVHAQVALQSQSDWKAEEILADVDAAIIDLSEADRNLIIRYFLQGETQQQIADDLDITQSTVKRRIDSAIEKLRSKIRRSGVVASALGALLLQQTSEASVPANLSTKLTKIGLAGNAGRATIQVLSPAKKYLYHPAFIAIVLSMLVLSGYFLVLAKYGSGLPFAEVPATTFQVMELKPKTFYQHYIKLNPGFDLQAIIQDVQQQIEEQGLNAAGPLTFIHPEGLLPEPERELIVSYPIDEATAPPDHPKVVRHAARKFATFKGNGSPPQMAIARLNELVSEAGLERNYDDRYVWSGHGTGELGNYEVQFGLK